MRGATVPRQACLGMPIPPWRSRTQQPLVPRLPARCPASSLGNETEAAPGNDAQAQYSEDDFYMEELPGRRRTDRGYTPFEFIEFSDTVLKHEVSMWVDRPVGDCFKVWSNRLNWMQWFDPIDEMGFHEEEPAYVSMYLWYRWATTPFLELYLTLERTKEEENKYILEEPVEGMPLVAAVLFTEGQFEDGEEGEGTPSAASGGGTTVTLRISYVLPKVLHEFAGQVAVYGDVDTKLQRCMSVMKEFVEAADLSLLEEVRAEDETLIRQGFTKQQRRKVEEEAKRQQRIRDWEAEVAAERGEAGGGAQAAAQAPSEEVHEAEVVESGAAAAEGEVPEQAAAEQQVPSAEEEGAASAAHGGRKRTRKRAA